MYQEAEMAKVIRQILRNDTEHRWFEITLMSDPVRRFRPSGDSADRLPTDSIQTPSHRKSLQDYLVPSANETIHPDRRKP
jgi:hypothetical protein